MIAPLSNPQVDAELDLLPEQLCPGLFVKLKLGWMDHPFVFNQFRIANQQQVDQILKLGLAKITYVPSRSTATPLPPGAVQRDHTVLVDDSARQTDPAVEDCTATPQSAGSGADLRVEQSGVAKAPDVDEALGDALVGRAMADQDAPEARPRVSVPDDPATREAGPPDDARMRVADGPAAETAHPVRPANVAKVAQAKRIASVRARIARCEQGYVKAASQIRTAMQGLHSTSEKSIQTARGVVDGLVASFGDDAEMVLHLMNEKLADETAYFHVLNVMVLSLMLGRELRLPADVLRVLGEGALFHDIGKLRVPDSVLRNPRRNRHEEEFYRLHTVYGREMSREMGVFPPAVSDIIELHHETLDGKGFPRGLEQDAIPLLARIVAITNRYDNLCNPVMRADGVTPAEALAQMFRKESSRWDKNILHRFVRMMGVYPPGSLVQLSNGNVGIVVAVDHADLLRPSVMVFDPDVPRSEAIVIDLTEEPEVKIDLALRPADLAPDATEYLSPKRRMSYFQSSRAGT